MTMKERVLRHLEDYGSITNKECFNEYGSTECRKIISTLRAEGVPITSIPQRGVNRYGETVKYSLYTLER